jgi:serine/threonine-protein kinase
LVEPSAPNRIGRYEILGRLGSGGMATVYLGRAVGPAQFQRLFAIKTIHPHLRDREAFTAMLLDEARTAARIRHPNVVPVFEVCDDEGILFLAMDYVNGEPLSAVLRRMKAPERPPFPLEIAAYIGLSSSEALHAAHELADASGKLLGVVHRDVSPKNILVGYDGVVRLLDFGVAKARDQLALTKDGSAKGTVAYMSPEQVEMRPLDRRSDVFALGVVLWEMTLRRRLFKAQSDLLTADNVRTLEVPKPSSIRPDYPPDLEGTILRALARDPNERFASARDLGLELKRFLASRSELITALEVEEFMKALFPDRYEEKCTMEREALTVETIQRRWNFANNASISDLAASVPSIANEAGLRASPADGDPNPSGPSALSAGQARLRASDGDPSPSGSRIHTFSDPNFEEAPISTAAERELTPTGVEPQARAPNSMDLPVRFRRRLAARIGAVLLIACAIALGAYFLVKPSDAPGIETARPIADPPAAAAKPEPTPQPTPEPTPEPSALPKIEAARPPAAPKRIRRAPPRHDAKRPLLIREDEL